MGKRKSDRRIIPARVAAKRAEIGIRQVDLVEKINTYIYQHPEEFPERQKLIDNTFISHWESGYRPIPDVYANALAYALGCSLEYIYGEDTIDGSQEPSKTGEIIPYNRIYLFDKQPVFVVFLNNFNLEQWGLVDIKNDEILFLTKRIRLSTTNKKDYNSIIKEVRPLAPYDLGVSGNNCEQQINLKQALIEDRVMIKMKSSDPYVTERYDGMYRHNENKTAFINAEGFVLPYEGINLSYNVYSVGYMDAAERMAYIQQNEEKDDGLIVPADFKEIKGKTDKSDNTVQKPIEVVSAPVKKRGRAKKEQEIQDQGAESSAAIFLQNMSIDDLIKEILKRMIMQS